jgi:hypothetical protein
MRTVQLAFARRVFFVFFAIILVGASFPSFGAELSIEYTTIARSGVTSIPGGVGKFTGHGGAPAIDQNGNVVFTGTGGNDSNGNYQAGVYTYINGNFQRVADRNTLVPGGGGATYDLFRGSDRHDIDNGRVAFIADISSSSTLMGVYTNVGQSSPSSLVEVAVADGDEWSVVSDPWVDGNVVAMRGQRQIPDQHYAIMLWDGTESFVDPGNGYIVSPNTQASTSADSSVFRRYKSGSSELGVYSNGFYETLVRLNDTVIPGQGGLTFSNVNNFPVVDRDGLDVAFRGNGSGGVNGVYKRADGGALEEVVSNGQMVPGGWIPGVGEQTFRIFREDGITMANGQVLFWGLGQNFLQGIYTDVGGALSVVLDNEDNNTIVLDGQTEQITSFSLSHKSFAFTPYGYEVVFQAYLASGGAAIIRATIGGEQDPGIDTFTVFKDFSDNSSAYVSVSLSCSSGTVTNSPQQASEASPEVFNINGAASNATCTAVENSVPSGYTKNESGCQNGDPVSGSCTIINTLNTPKDDIIMGSGFE